MSPSPSYALFEKEHETVVSDGTPIRYTVRGPLPGRLPVVLANGWSCSDAYWVHVVPFLEAAGHTVVLPDVRGHGESGLPREPGLFARNLTVDDMSVERNARDLFEVCDAAGVEGAVFMGHSMGVQTILEAYHQEPARVRGLVAMAGAYENPLRTFYGRGFWDPLFPLGQLMVGAIPVSLLKAWWRVGGSPAFGLKAAQLLGAAGPKVTKEGIGPYLAHLGTRSPAVLFKAVEGMRRHSAADWLASIDVPVLVLTAGKDRFTPPALQRHMHDVIPDSEFVEFEDATHCLPLEEPDAINAALARFLERVESRQPVAS